MWISLFNEDILIIQSDFRLNKRKVEFEMKYKKAIVWVLTVILSIGYIYFGYLYASKNLEIMENEDNQSVKAVVIEVIKTIEEEDIFSETNAATNITKVFSCELLEGNRKGETVLAMQVTDAFSFADEEWVEPGDKIMIFHSPYDEYGTEWIFNSYVRLDSILIFAAGFFVLLLLFGRLKGLNTMLSLVFTCLAIFIVYIPSILNGQNIYISTLVTCVFITIMTIMITNGWGQKSLATILGCLFGVLVAASLSILMDNILQLTGVIDEHSIYLTFLSTEKPINLNAIIFGSIVVSSLGAVMDVAMDISSSLFELVRHAERISMSKLVKSGITIGRDILGTMSNTLILAYIGSSLSTILILTTYASSLNELLNREMIVVEMAQALIASTAILLTIPLTAIACGLIYIGIYMGKRTHQRANSLESQ